MTEQQYRVIADRDKGDDVDHFEWDAQRGDRVTWEVVNDIAEAEIVRVERPVPAAELPDPLNLTDTEADSFTAVMQDPQPVSRPTRKQIAETVDIAAAEYWREPALATMNTRITDAVLALIQNGADRG